MKKHIPNFITSLNLVSGFIAVIFAATGDLLTASWLIAAAMIFDFLDGFSARLLEAYSDVGKELDSLADVVSFGVAPAVIIYNLLNNSVSTNPPDQADANGKIGFVIMLIIPAIMPVCAALRLAIFNLDASQATSFKGLPTPANAIAVISLVVAGHYSGSSFIALLTGSPVFLTLFSVTLSLLMISRINLFSLKISNLKFKGNEGRYLMVFLLAAAFVILGVNATALIIPVYIISSLVSGYL